MMLLRAVAGAMLRHMMLVCWRRYAVILDDAVTLFDAA